jgi:hypothetical protein
MARGRFISNAITSDKKINDLSDDTSRLAFTWLVTFADCEGRTHGDPAMVRSLLFPRRSDVTNERMEAYIAEWQAAGLIRVYASNGDLWIDFPNFSKHQTGLRKDHEAASTIPPFEDGITTESLRSKDVVETPQIKYKISKDKVSKEKISAAKPPTPPQIESYRKAAHRYPNKSLYDLICEHVKDDETSLTLFEKIVTGWIAMGWNPANINGILEFVDRGEVPHKNGQHDTTPPEQPKPRKVYQ